MAVAGEALVGPRQAVRARTGQHAFFHWISAGSGITWGGRGIGQCLNYLYNAKLDGQNALVY